MTEEEPKSQLRQHGIAELKEVNNSCRAKEIDPRYIMCSCYVAPNSKPAHDAFALIREPSAS